MITAESLRSGPALSAGAELAGRAKWLAPAAAGVFAGAALFDLIPSAAGTLGSGVLPWAAAGLALMMAAVAMVNSPDRRWIGWAAGLGIWMHSILEGVAAGTGYGVSAGAGAIMSIGLIVHLVPESLALFALVTSTGGSLRRALTCCAVPWALVLAGFTGSRFFAGTLPAVPLGRAMAFGAGTMICLAVLSWGQSSGSKMKAASVAALGLLWVAAQHLA